MYQKPHQNRILCAAIKIYEYVNNNDDLISYHRVN